MNILSSVDFWAVAAPLFGAVIAWIANERRKQYWELYKRKEDSYKKLLDSVIGYYRGVNDQELRNEFLRQFNHSWLYCPDDVVKKGYHFLHLIQDGVEATDKERSEALGKLVCAMRHDIFPKKRFSFWQSFGFRPNTHLKYDDFKTFIPKNK